MFDPLVINPAYAGSQVQLSATGVYRNQWVNFPGAPKTFTSTIHSSFNQSKVGVGFLLGKDVIGVHSETFVYGIYSYKIQLTKYQERAIRFGIQGGFNNLKSDYGQLDPKDPDIFGTLTKLNPNFGVGVLYTTKNSYLGISVPYLLNNRIIDSEVISSRAQQYRYYYIAGGFTREVTPNFKVIPSALLRFQERAPLSFDVNLEAVLYDVVGLGASYRLDDSILALFELQINENFHVGYAYDFTTSDIRLYSNGTHELMINYRIKIDKIHGGMVCPAYW